MQGADFWYVLVAANSDPFARLAGLDCRAIRYLRASRIRFSELRLQLDRGVLKTGFLTCVPLYLV